MDAKAFFDRYGREESERVALAAGTNIAYFSQIIYGHRRPSADLAKQLEQHSGGRMDVMALLFPPDKAAATKDVA